MSRAAEILRELEVEFMDTVWSLSHDSMWGEDEVCHTFRCLELESGLPREFVRALCRRLTEQGLMRYSSGLCSEDGEFVGAGYGLTRRGVKWCRENLLMREFTVWRENDEKFDDGRKVRSLDAESAAEKWAEEEDWSSADYLIVSQRDTPVVCVQEPEGAVRRYRVSGESVAVYTAREIMDDVKDCGGSLASSA